MALLRNRGNGQTSGTPVSNTNSDDFGESQFQFVSPPGTGTLTYDNTHVLSGQTNAFKVVPASAEARYAQYGGSVGNLGSSDIAVQVDVYRTAVPTAQYSLVRGLNTAGTRRLNVDIDTTGHLVVRAENVATLFTFTNALALNAFNRIKLFSRNQGAGASYLKVALYNAAGTLVEEHETNTADRTEQIAAVAFGKGGSDTTTGTFWFADPQVETVAGGYIGDVVPALLGTTTTVALIDYTASPGALTGWTITPISGADGVSATNLGTALWSVPIPSTGDAVWRVSANSGATVLTDDVTVSAIAAVPVGPLRPTGTLPSTTWIS